MQIRLYKMVCPTALFCSEKLEKDVYRIKG